jgi:lipopolysaccharide/colanic/teichoic acid biosynthesis glycosyltransferase
LTRGMRSMTISNQTPAAPKLQASASGSGIPAVFDVLFSGACLVCLAPIVLLIAIAIRIDSRGPILYSQMRLGQGGRPFRLYKFRKFHHQAPVAGGALTVANDPRLTRVGWFLERTKLDELPQLWNIVRGEMSVVGPRPETPHFADCFVAGFRAVLDYKPGMFGPAQAMARNESALYQDGHDPEVLYRTVLFPAKARIDLAYYPTRTVIRDVSWIFAGIMAVLGWSRLPQIHMDSVADSEDWVRQDVPEQKVLGESS